MKRRRLLAAGCAHCALLALSGVHAADQWSEPPRFARPPEDSDEGGLWGLFDREEARLRRSPFLIADTALQSYLQDLACRLGSTHCPDIRTYPLRTPWFNASMAANGMMQVWSGLLLRCDNESQLATVIGHEIGHYLERHGVLQLRSAKSRSAWGQMMMLFGGVAGIFAQIPLVAGALAFSRDQERDADRIGLLLMRKAGYDTREAPKVWDNLLAEVRAGEGGDPTKKSVLFATHPPSDERRDTLTALAGDGGGTVVGAEAYEAAIRPVLPLLLADELRRARYDETIAMLDRKLAQRPERSDFRYYRAEAKRLRGKPEDAAASLADLEEAVRRGSEPAETHRALGMLFLDADRARAASAFGRYLELAPQATDRGMIESYLSELKP